MPLNFFLMNVTYACKDTDVSFKTLAPQKLFHSHCFSVFVYFFIFPVSATHSRDLQVGKIWTSCKKIQTKEKIWTTADTS